MVSLLLGFCFYVYDKLEIPKKIEYFVYITVNLFCIHAIHKIQGDDFMDSMTLNLNKESLSDLMKDFFLLTGIKIALFDVAGNEILSYPDRHCPFCTLIRSTKNGETQCLRSNQKSFVRCQSTKQLEVFHCHAGLIETTAPLIDNDAIIGYIMFGQITDRENPSDVTAMLKDVMKRFSLDQHGYNASIYAITVKTQEQIHAAAKILEACTFYVLLKDMVSLQRENFIQNLNAFLLDHLAEDLSVDRLTDEFHISKNKLYDSCSRYLSVGIAAHIKQLRITEAKRLLKTTDLSVHDISDKVGFNDYNYFCRVFKKEAGMSAGRYRKICCL
jgi:AraC-like DNA-binding protein